MRKNTYQETESEAVLGLSASPWAVVISWQELAQEGL